MPLCNREQVLEAFPVKPLYIVSRSVHNGEDRTLVTFLHHCSYGPPVCISHIEVATGSGVNHPLSTECQAIGLEPDVLPFAHVLHEASPSAVYPGCAEPGASLRECRTVHTRYRLSTPERTTPLRHPRKVRTNRSIATTQRKSTNEPG